MSIAFQTDGNVVFFPFLLKIIAISSNAKYLEYNESGSLLHLLRENHLRYST